MDFWGLENSQQGSEHGLGLTRLHMTMPWLPFVTLQAH